MKVSIVIPVYNVGQYLASCLDTCINQSYRDLEIICVNDGSKDNSLDIIREYMAKDTRIKCVNKYNGGLPSAREAGVAVVTGEYLFHLDGDDDMPQDAIESLVRVAEKECADMVIGDYNTIENGQKIYTNSDIKESLSSEEYIRYILTRGLFNIWGRLIKTNLYKDNDIKFPHNISMAEDLVQTYQLAHYATKIASCHSCCYNYYIRTTSMSKTNGQIGELADRTIYAMLFVREFAERHTPGTLNKNLQDFLGLFLFQYICSPHPISIRKKELLQLVRTIDYNTVRRIKDVKQRLFMYIALRNISIAKLLMNMKNRLKR